MRTEYGYRRTDGSECWLHSNYEKAVSTARGYGCVLIAREVSEPRIVSIR